MTNSSQSISKVGDRIECGGHFGTVKYVGTIEGKPSIWLGIDWDDPTRGKHDGSVNGKQYFTARFPNSGTFIRPEKVNFGKSAISSVVSRYGAEEDEFTAKINQQKRLLMQQTMNAPFLEMVGFDKVFNKQSDLSTLKIVNIREQNVNSVGKELGATCPQIEELDISKNLLSSWLDIFEICSQLPKLNWLRVCENQMKIPENYQDVNFPNIKTLICGTMALEWADILKLTTVFPHIQELRLPNNKIVSLDPIPNFQDLELLDLESNDINKWYEVCKLDCAPKLQQLNIENINLSVIKFDEDMTSVKVPIFKNLRRLCIVKNFINEWSSVGELNRLHNLEHLKISKNPILDTEDRETVYQIITSRIATLKVLNGVEISPGERRGAEYDYIKKYGLEWLKVKGTEQESDFLKLHNRYRELIEMYGEPEESELVVKEKVIDTSLIVLKIIFKSRTKEKRLPPTLSVQKLIMLVQKLYSLKNRPDLIYKSTSDPLIEILLDDELKEIGVYSMQDGDQIIVKV